MSIMPEANQERPLPSGAVKSEVKENVTCHLVKLPQIVLTRVDELEILKPKTKLSSLAKKKPLKSEVDKKTFSSKKLLKTKKTQNTKTTLNPKKPAIKIVNDGKVQKRSRGKPKKLADFVSPIISKKIKVETKKKDVVPIISPKNVYERPKGAIKNLLKKATLQKRSKIVIPSVKKGRPPANKQNKLKPAISKKPAPPKPILEVLTGKSADSDSSEDDFLYDELIEELESSGKKIGVLKPSFEKTTNITLKPNEGNKPPTIVKGGIVKRTDIPPDLKSIAPLKNTGPNCLKKQDELISDKPITGVQTKRKSIVDNSPSVNKKPSPWPISISQNKENSKTQSYVKKNVQPISSPNKTSDKPTVNPPTIHPLKPKIGPKQTATVIPISKTLSQDNNLSDEYTEEETLESEVENIFSSKGENELPKTKPYGQEEVKENSADPITENTVDDEDPNLDLIRILTDDSEEPMPDQPDDLKGNTTNNVIDTASNDKLDSELTLKDDISSLKAELETNTKESLEIAPNEIVEDPPVRTLYDLMNEVAMQYPSWNLHIIPETNAFCIAQVTKGRLGLPTLKKCIELDPEDYSAKVYIHQYHIKRFDGVYDSEESILALVHEINSIRA